MKKYISNSVISISVALPNGEGTRISFFPQSNGMSVFYTSDKDIQWALEHHYKFGKLFRLEKETPDANISKSKRGAKLKGQTKKEITSVVEPDNHSDETNGKSEDTVGEAEIMDDDTPEYTEVVVSDMDDAKDYLAEHFDVVRTKLKKEEDIVKTALSFGVVFKVS